MDLIRREVERADSLGGLVRSKSGLHLDILMLLPTCSIGFNINYGRACGIERLDFFLHAPRRSVGWQRADAIDCGHEEEPEWK